MLLFCNDNYNFLYKYLTTQNSCTLRILPFPAMISLLVPIFSSEKEEKQLKGRKKVCSTRKLVKIHNMRVCVFVPQICFCFYKVHIPLLRDELSLFWHICFCGVEVQTKSKTLFCKQHQIIQLQQWYQALLVLTG